MSFKTFFINIGKEIKEFAGGLTSNYLFYAGLGVAGKLMGALDVPWVLVFALPLISPANLKKAFDFLSNAASDVVKEIKK